MRRRRGLAIHTYTDRTRLHNFDLARAHVAYLVDLGATLANDTPDEVVRDVDLLRLQLGLLLLLLLLRLCMAGSPSLVRRGRVSGSTGHVRRALVRCPAARHARGPIGRVLIRWHPLVRLDEDVADVVGRDMDGVSHTGDAENTLRNGT